MPKQFLQELLNEILDLGPKIGVYDKDAFRDFINMSEKIFVCYEGYSDRLEQKQMEKLTAEQ